MKKFIFLPFLLSLLTLVSVKINASDVLYSLPKSELCVEIVLEKTMQTPGVFYQYSQRYLATSNVITQEKTAYVLKSISVKSRTLPDMDRTYAVSVSKKSPAFSLNEQGILYAINASTDNKKDVSDLDKRVFRNDFTTSNKAGLYKKETNEKLKESWRKKLNLLPLNEEYMLASSSAKMAEGAAKQIYRIRENRMALLSGDLDQLPADGASLKEMLNGLDLLEQELTELFIGTTTTEVERKTIYFTPENDVKKHVLFRLSAFNGIVEPNDLSGTPYYLSIESTLPALLTKDEPVGKKSKAKADNTVFYSIQPASVKITIDDGIKNHVSTQIYLPQLGILQPISDELILQGKLIRIDPNTGRLLGIE